MTDLFSRVNYPLENILIKLKLVVQRAVADT